MKEDLGYDLIKVLDNIGRHQLMLKHYVEAETAYQEELSHLNRLQNISEIRRGKSKASTCHQLGSVAETQEQWQQAREYFLKALEIFVDFNSEYELGITLHSLARLWQASRDARLPAAVAAVLGISSQEAEEVLKNSTD